MSRVAPTTDQVPLLYHINWRGSFEVCNNERKDLLQTTTATKIAIERKRIAVKGDWCKTSLIWTDSRVDIKLENCKLGSFKCSFRLIVACVCLKTQEIPICSIDSFLTIESIKAFPHWLHKVFLEVTHAARKW